MADYTELEIGLFLREGDDYTVELRFNDPHDQASHSPVRGVTQFNFAELRAKRLNPEVYGKGLSDSLFADANIRSYYDQVSAVAQTVNRPLRLRLNIDVDAPGLHDLRWETLRDPRTGYWLLTNENLLFSRFLTSTNWDRVQLRPKGDLRALVVIANPQDLAQGKYQVDNQTLAPVDVKGELERAQQGLGTILQDSLISDPSKPGQASLNNLTSRLREGYDILYLVCHGALLTKDPAGPYLWLEEDDGTAAVIPGIALVERIKDLSTELRPRLVVLASCQSAGQGGLARASDAQGALAALGPRLAQVGIPAVLAMQGDITMETVAHFMPVFFQELARDGQIDRAMAVARGGVRDRPDSWIPVLFLRLRGGRIWYVPGFGEERGGFEKWPALIRSITRSQSTPILGPGLYETLLGSQREISQHWADAYHYPMEIHDRESLPQVAQFLTVNQYQRAPYDELGEYLKGMIRTKYNEDLPSDLHNDSAPLDELIEIVGTKRREGNPADPYRMLAQLPLPVYITTNADNLMASALKNMGKDPQVVLCPWNDYVEQIESVYDREPDYQPTPQRPLVYHLFGRLDEPDSIVLTEDDFFDFLIGVTRNRDLIPSPVRRSLADTALLFLGFQMDDWQFRVLFRSILSQQGGERRARYPHIAVQIEPDESRIPEPERARRYLETYFFQGANISLYWGGVEDFIRELLTRWNQLNR
ncbi:MAG TPA: CHAT domain-containing protein [Anaerolineales bacterium]|nr:CHAT domain-containing protein [Anaerolineales bacterium]